MSAPRLELDNVTLGHDRHPAVHHLSGVFAPGQLTAICGPNGAGKSTLLKGLKGLLHPLQGQIRRQGISPAHIAWLPQQAELCPDFPISVEDVVLLGHWRKIGPWGGVSRADRDRVRAALSAVGLEGFAARPFEALSIGQRQRVLFARVLQEDSPVILLDEPFAAIDAKTTADLLALVARWGQEGRTVIAVLHDHAQIHAHFSQTLLLARDLIGWGATSDVLTPANLDKAARMSESWQRDAGLCRRSAA